MIPKALPKVRLPVSPNFWTILHRIWWEANDTSCKMLAACTLLTVSSAAFCTADSKQQPEQEKKDEKKKTEKGENNKNKKDKKRKGSYSSSDGKRVNKTQQGKVVVLAIPSATFLRARLRIHIELNAGEIVAMAMCWGYHDVLQVLVERGSVE